MTDNGDSITVHHWNIGVCLAIFGCFVDATGWIIEKKSHIYLRESFSELGKEVNIDYLCHCNWWFGFCLHMIGTFIFCISLGLGQQTLITPLQSFSLLFNAIFAWKFLNEKLTKLQIIGTLICVAGCAGAIAFGPSDAATIHNAFLLENYFHNAAFLAFAVLLSIIFVCNYIIYKCAMVTNKYYLMFCEIGFSAYFGSWSALFTKCTVEIVGTTAAGMTRNWSHWLPYFCCISIIITAIALEYWRQEALKHYPGSYVGSIYNTEIIVCGICFGAFFFSEFKEMAMIHIVLFIASVALSLFGVSLLAIGDKEIIQKVEDQSDEYTMLLHKDTLATEQL